MLDERDVAQVDTREVLPLLAGGAGHHDGPHALGSGTGEHAAARDGLVVRMRVHAQQDSHRRTSSARH